MNNPDGTVVTEKQVLDDDLDLMGRIVSEVDIKYPNKSDEARAVISGQLFNHATIVLFYKNQGGKR